MQPTREGLPGPTLGSAQCPLTRPIYWGHSVVTRLGPNWCKNGRKQHRAGKNDALSCNGDATQCCSTPPCNVPPDSVEWVRQSLPPSLCPPSPFVQRKPTFLRPERHHGDRHVVGGGRPSIPPALWSNASGLPTLDGSRTFFSFCSGSNLRERSKQIRAGLLSLFFGSKATPSFFFSLPFWLQFEGALNTYMQDKASFLFFDSGSN